MQTVGVGRRENLGEIVERVEREFLQNHAAPARLVLQGDGVEVECERSQVDAPFRSFVVRFAADVAKADALRQLQSEFPEETSLSEAEGGWEFQIRFAGESADQPPILDQLSQMAVWPEVWRVSGEDFAAERLSPQRLFEAMRDMGASDIHLYPGASPVFRVNDRTRSSEEFAAVSQRQIEELVRSLAPDAAWDAFQRDRQCSFKYRQLGVANARVSVFIKTGVPHCTIRYLSEQIPSFEDLHIPRATMERLAQLHEGLVLVSGMTGSGKSTTVASLIDWINRNKSLHILTIESPVEFVHRNEKSIVSQRDVGTDTPTAVEAVYGALRHDPDVIFIGEMRDPDTIRAAIDAAGTGHLVISTFHTNTASEVINRIVSFFAPVERDLVRLQLRDCLRCVMCQRLLPRKEGGRIPALEFLFNDTPQIGDCVLSGDTGALRVAMQQTASDSSILEQSLLALVREQQVEEEVAGTYAANPAILEQMQLGTYAVPSLESLISRHR